MKRLFLSVLMGIGGLACACIAAAWLAPLSGDVPCGADCHIFGLEPAPAWVVTIIAVGIVLGMIPLTIRYIYNPYRQISIGVAFLLYSGGGIATVIVFIIVGFFLHSFRNFWMELFCCIVLPTAFIGLITLLRHILPQEPKQKRKRKVSGDE